MAVSFFMELVLKRVELVLKHMQLVIKCVQLVLNRTQLVLKYATRIKIKICRVFVSSIPHRTQNFSFDKSYSSDNPQNPIPTNKIVPILLNRNRKRLHFFKNNS